MVSYGEIFFEFGQYIIDELDVFVDLGSGIGQVVPPVAGSYKLKNCFFVDNTDKPAEYAKEMSVHFKHWMKFFEKRHSEYTLIKEDLLYYAHKQILDFATVIFVNNLMFVSALAARLKEKFLKLKDGTIKTSSKCLKAIESESLEAILNVSVLKLKPGSVSWSNKMFPLYLRTVDRAKLQEF